MKNSLPTGWEWKILEDVCDKASSNISQNQLDNEIGEYPIFGASGLIKKISFYHQEKEYIGIVKDGAGVGRVTFLPKQSSVIGTLQYLIPKEDVDIKFLFYFLKGLDFVKFISGSTIPHIYYKNYKDEHFPQPPIEEQKKIVAILENSFTKLDQAIVLVKQNIEKIKQLDESALSEVFEKLSENKVSKKKLVDIADVKRGKSKHRPRNDKRLYNGNYPLIQTGDIRNAGKFLTEFTQTYNETGLAQSKLWEKGTVCLTIAANIGDVAILGIDACFPDSVVGIHSKTEDNIYIYYFLKSIKKQLDNKSSASAQKNLSVEKLSDFYIPLPPLSEQQRIVSHLDRLTQNNSQLLQHYQKKLEALQRLKNSVLESAFKGEFKKEPKAKTFNLAFYQMQLIGLSIDANKHDNIPQGEMAIAKDMYLLDRLYQVPTKMNFVNHSWGPFAPEIKKGITNKTYFGKKNFPNSKATYVVTQNDEALFKTVSAELKSQVFFGINELNSKVFFKVSMYKRAETKELLATVLKCIEDTQSIDLLVIRQAMQNWKIEQGEYKTKAEKFSENRTQLVIKFIVKENWHLKVLR